MKLFPRRESSIYARRDHPSGVRRRKRFVPGFFPLELRRLLSVQFSWLGYAGTPVDLTGPTASPGADGIQDLHLQLTGLPTSAIDSVTITGPAKSQTYPSGFSWTYGQTAGSDDANPAAGPGVQVIIESSTTTADIYFSPIVQQINSAGQISNATLPSNSVLTLSVTLNGGQTFTPSGFNAGTTSPAPADTAPTLPTLSYAPFPTTFEGQSSTTGIATINITSLPVGATINNNSLELSDEAGLGWAVQQSGGRSELGMTVTPSGPNNTQAIITFPPVRDEAGSTMTLSYQLSGSPTQYVTDIEIPSGSHTYRSLLSPGAYPISSTPLMLSPGGGENLVSYTNPGNQVVTVDIQTLLNEAANGTYNNFEFTAGTYQIDEVLVLSYPMTLQGVGSGSDLEFMFGSTASTPSTPGAINLRSSHVTLENFGISFGQSSVDLDYGYAGIIDAYDVNAYQTTLVDLNISGLTIHAAPDSQDIDTAYEDDLDPDGYAATQTIEMSGNDSGTIANNWIYGGTIAIQGGPWVVSGNNFVGSVQGTISTTAFSVTAGHDVTIQGNILTDPSPSNDGQLLRFITGGHGGYNINIIDNNISQNVGDLVSSREPNSQEMILPEDYGKVYEGSTLATSISSASGSYNSRVIVIPSSELYDQVVLARNGASSFLLLFILDGSNVGLAIPVAQSFPNGSSTEFVLASSLPQGTFDFAIDNTYNGFTVSGNTINTSGTISDGLVLASNFNNVQVTGNTFIGDQTIGSNGWFGSAMGVAAWSANYGTSTLGTFDQGQNSYYNVGLTSLSGIVISGNTIENSIGGVGIEVATGSTIPTTYGRTYASISMKNNNFVYTYQNQNIIRINDSSLGSSAPTEYSELVNGTTVEPDPNQPNTDYFVDPRDLAITTSGNTITWSGVSPPATDVLLDAADLNGTLYDAETYTTSTSPPILAVGNGVAVDLSQSFDIDGITADSNTSIGNLDGNGNSYSSAMLGSTVGLNGLSFNVGAAGGNNVVRGLSQTIALPRGQYSSLDFLGTAVNGEQTVTFTVTYADGSTTQVSQSLDDWTNDIGQTGEKVALSMSYRNPHQAITVYLYGYNIPLNPAKTVASITMPSDNNVEVLAIDLVPATATQVNLSSAFSIDGITNDNNGSIGNLDGGGNSYSANQLWSLVSVGGLSYNIGAAGVNNVVRGLGQTIALPSGQDSSLDFLGTAVNGEQTATFTVTFADGTTTQATQAMDDWANDHGQTGEAVALSMPYRNPQRNIGVYLYEYSIPLNSAKTVASITMPSDNNVEVLAIDLVPAPITVTPVSLSSAFNLDGITADNNTSIGNLDGGGNSYSGNLLGSSVSLNGLSYNIGAAGVNNVVRGLGQTIALPSGQDSSLDFLGTAVNGEQTATFTVTYADGTTTQVTQAIDDWTIDHGQTGEAVALSMPYRNPHQSLGIYLYGYSIPLHSARIVVSITMPSDNNVDVLAIDLVPAPITVTPVSLSSAFNLDGITADNNTSIGNLDGAGNTYSGNLLGSSVSFNGLGYNIGPVGGNNVVQGSGQTIALPSGQESSLDFLGTAVNGEQTATFTVTYADGNTTQATQAIDDWANDHGQTGEAVALSMPYRNPQSSIEVYLYEYSVPLNSAKTVASITMPSDNNVKVLAIDLVAASSPDVLKSPGTPRPISVQGRKAVQAIGPAMGQHPGASARAAVVPGSTPSTFLGRSGPIFAVSSPASRPSASPTPTTISVVDLSGPILGPVNQAAIENLPFRKRSLSWAVPFGS